ncbi:MAG: hypothetical protein L6R48_06140 [Planctomycetes bacterium]|nr:hypothetical protein [Planctomycetota bacterium]
MKTLLPCILALALASALPAADGATLTPADPIAASTFQGAKGGPAKHSVVPVAGQAFPAAVRLQVLTACEQDWHVNVLVPVEGAVAKDEALEVEFWVRAEAAAGVQPVLRVVHQRTSAPFANTVEETVRPTATWERKVVAYKARSAWTAGESRLGFFVGSAVQTVEIGGISLRRAR